MFSARTQIQNQINVPTYQWGWSIRSLVCRREAGCSCPGPQLVSVESHWEDSLYSEDRTNVNNKIQQFGTNSPEPLPINMTNQLFESPDRRIISDNWPSNKNIYFFFILSWTKQRWSVWFSYFSDISKAPQMLFTVFTVQQALSVPAERARDKQKNQLLAKTHCGRL